MTVMIHECPVCGSGNLDQREVLWDKLTCLWELLPDEKSYINRQQGFYCKDCGNNLRAMALASAIVKTCDFENSLADAVSNVQMRNLSVLEVNPAGALTATLSKLSGHRLISYPEYDLQQLDVSSETFDLVIHSDTLEHIPDPVKALSECRRVLKRGGRCVFTVPIVVGRMTRSRQGLPASYHGAEGEGGQDLLVHSEFGADVWAYVMQAGFTSCEFYSLEYPAGLAIVARL